MKISVVTVCFNANPVIEGCLTSVAEQTYPDIEHVVIDGLSTDGTVDAVRRYPHVATMASERDRGIYDAMNKGIARATGEFVLFLNADDRFASADAIEQAVAAIARDPGADVYYGRLEVRTLDGAAHVFRPPPPEDAPEFMVYGCLPHQATLARLSVFAKTGPFDLRYRYHADYDWFLKVLADPGIDVRFVDVVIGSFLMGGASSQLEKGQPEVYAIQNASPLYATPEWDRRRIESYQAAFLRERLETARLGGELRAEQLRGRTVRLGEATVTADSGNAAVDAWRIVLAALRIAGGRLGAGVRSATAGLHWKLIEACLRHLPSGAVDLLRRVRGMLRGR